MRSAAIAPMTLLVHNNHGVTDCREVFIDSAVTVVILAVKGIFIDRAIVIVVPVH